ELVAGDFLEGVPRGGDVYLLKNVLHDWPDDAARRILQACRAAMLPTAHLFVVEQVVPVGNTESAAKWADLTVLVNFAGRERTEAEFRDLFASAGLILTGVIATTSRLSVLEAVPS